MQTLSTELDGFAAAYSFLSRALLVPADEQLLAALADPALLPEWPLPRDEATRRGLALLAAAVAEPESASELVRDYERLFVGPDKLLAPPYESVYLSEEGLLFDPPTMAVRESYREFGLVAPQLNREPDDHIGLEFDFVAQLCARAIDGLERGDADLVQVALSGHRAFLERHLLRWGDQCLSRVEAAAETRFYQGVGALGSGVLAQARDRFLP